MRGKSGGKYGDFVRYNAMKLPQLSTYLVGLKRPRELRDANSPPALLASVSVLVSLDGAHLLSGWGTVHEKSDHPRTKKSESSGERSRDEDRSFLSWPGQARDRRGGSMMLETQVGISGFDTGLASVFASNSRTFFESSN